MPSNDSLADGYRQWAARGLCPWCVQILPVAMAVETARRRQWRWPQRQFWWCLFLLTPAHAGAFDAWMLLLASHGTMRPREVLASFIAFAGAGVPIKPDIYNSLGFMSKHFVEEWPSSGKTLPLPCVSTAFTA